MCQCLPTSRKATGEASSQKIVAVVPRKFPADAQANATTAAEWWNSHMRELTGRQPQHASESDHLRLPEGEAPAVGNGQAQQAQPAQAAGPGDQGKQQGHYPSVTVSKSAGNMISRSSQSSE